MRTDLSLTGKRWILDSHEEGVVHDASSLLRLLVSKRQLEQTDRHIDPWIFPDMPKATKRILDAVQKNERVGIFGDYDCDGVTSAAQLVRFFRRHGLDPFVRLPHRVYDGYGLNMNIVEELSARKIDLLITVDTGISSAVEVQAMNEKGIDVIITDHHHAPSVHPNAYAIIHPALAPGFLHPHPSGAGVAYHLVSALENGAWNDHDTDIALAMIGTVADLVELRGINRLLVQQGLQALTRMQEGTLATLVQSIQGEGRKLTSTDVAFRIVPRINAAGRMEDPMLALRALLDGGDSLEMLHHLNTERQERTTDLYKKALDMIRTEHGDVLPPLLSCFHKDFHPGIVGLIAGRLTEQFGRPSMIGHTDGSECTASLRSIPSYNITKGLQQCSRLLLRYGGHAQAAGCTLLLSDFQAVCEALKNDISSTVPSDLLSPSVVIDAILDPQDITLEFCSALSQLEPYGQGNPEPRFLLTNVQPEFVRQIGADGAHVQARIAGAKAVGFHLGLFASHMTQPLDIICRIGTDNWQGKLQPQIFIEDVRVQKNAPVGASS